MSLEISVYYRIIISILGLGLPLLVAAVLNLDSKYESLGVIRLFLKERALKCFAVIIGFSIVIVFICSLNLEPTDWFLASRFYVSNSNGWLLLISSSFLLVTFIWLIIRMIQYYSLERFTKILKAKLDTNIENNDALQSLMDVLQNSILKKNRAFVDLALRAIDDVHAKEEGERAISFEHKRRRFFVYHQFIARQLCESQVKFPRVAARIYGGTWTFPSSLNLTLNFDDYLNIWSIVRLAAYSKREDLLITMWRKSYSRVNSLQHHIKPPFSHTWSDEKLTAHQVQVKSEIDRLVRFNIIFSGLALSQSFHALVKDMFSYKMSSWGNQVLLPQQMDAILEKYDCFFHSRDTFFSFIEAQFPFPNYEGIAKDWMVQTFILDFLGLVFLRQWTLTNQIYGQDHLAIQDLPDTTREIDNWIKSLEDLDKRVRKLLENSELIDTHRLSGHLSKELYFGGRLDPRTLIEHTISQLKEKLESVERSVEIHEGKINAFETSSKRIFEEVVSEVSTICGNSKENDKVIGYIKGEYSTTSKNILTELPTITDLSFDYYLATELASKIRTGLAQVIDDSVANDRQFRLNMRDFPAALTRLKINQNHVIVAVDLDLDFLIGDLEDYDSEESTFHGAKILRIKGSRHGFRGIYLFEKHSLPSLNFLPLPTEIMDKYELNNLIDEENIFFSVIDLNQIDQDRRNEFRASRDSEDNRKYALLSIMFNLEIKWQNSPEYFQFGLYNEFDSNQTLSSLDELPTLEDTSKVTTNSNDHSKRTLLYCLRRKAVQLLRKLFR